MSRTPVQRFEYREIARSALTSAPYNPRRISDYAKRKLRKQLAAGGLVEALVWNERTGHLVSGHQRLGLLDDLEGGADYTLGVAVVDLAEDVERTQNVFFNNIYAQGAYDEERFVALVQAGATLDGMGFTITDLEQEFGIVPALDPSFAATRESQAPLVDAIREVEKNRKYGEVDARVKAQNEAIGNADSDYAIAIIFATTDDRDAFAERHGADERFLFTADQLIPLLQERYLWRPRTDADDEASVHVPGDSPEPDHAGALQPTNDR